MKRDTLTGRMALAALGACGAYIGFRATDAGHLGSVLPMSFALGMAFTGFLLIVKSGRRVRLTDSQPLALPHPASGEDTQAHAALLVPRQTNGEALSPGLEAQGFVAPPWNSATIPASGRLALNLNPSPPSTLHWAVEALSHEIKNYLCTLKGSAHLLRQRSLGRDGAIIDRIDRVVEKLESFTRTMTSTPDATSTGLLGPMDMGEAAQSCVRTHFHGAEEAFRWNILPDAPMLMGDPNRLEQVFLNLYTNAREAGARRVTTSVARDGERLQIFIEDDGNGCAPEDLARIFEPFFSTKCGPARRGLGMFVVQSIVENHGGRIKVRSKNGSGDGARGLVFLLDFPFSLPASSLVPSAAPLSVPEADHLGAPQAWTFREQAVLRSQERMMAVPGPC